MMKSSAEMVNPITAGAAAALTGQQFQISDVPTSHLEKASGLSTRQSAVVIALKDGSVSKHGKLTSRFFTQEADTCQRLNDDSEVRESGRRPVCMSHCVTNLRVGCGVV